MKEAYLAGGCFWCISYSLSSLNGVKNIISGYSGGDEINPTYAEVKHQKTNHRETIKITYDETIISYSSILDAFLENIDPLDGSGQFGDKGHSYTLAIYYQSEEEKIIAENKIKELQNNLKRKPWISVEKFKSFYQAEEYHQNYAQKHPEEFKQELILSGRKK